MLWTKENFRGTFPSSLFESLNTDDSLSRSKSVPRPPFTLFTPPSSSESNKRGDAESMTTVFAFYIAVPMNKIVLKPTRPKINLKNIKPKVNTLENTNHKVSEENE